MCPFTCHPEDSKLNQGTEDDSISASGTATANDPWTVRRILDWTIPFLKEHGSDTPRLDAEILLAHARKCPRIRLYTDFDQLLTEQQRTVMRDLVKRRSKAEPVAYLVGHREFFSLDFEIGPGVFVPRPDTEMLVVETLDLIEELPSPQVLELCTGSGCIPVSIAKNNTKVQVTTVEREEVPFSFAQKNIEKHGVGDRVQLLEGDLFGPIPDDSKFDVIVSNPPYILASEIPTLQADVRDHEPHAALDGGPDGLDSIRILIDESPDYLKNNGWLLFELDRTIVDPAVDLMNRRGFDSVQVKEDISGQPRVVLGRWQ